MNRRRRLRLGPEEVIERDHAPGFGGRDDQATANVIERPATDPPGAILDGMKGGQQQVTAVLDLVDPPARDARVARRVALAAGPTRLRRPQQGINRLPLLTGRLGADDM